VNQWQVQALGLSTSRSRVQRESQGVFCLSMLIWSSMWKLQCHLSSECCNLSILCTFLRHSLWRNLHGSTASWNRNRNRGTLSGPWLKAASPPALHVQGPQAQLPAPSCIATPWTSDPAQKLPQLCPSWKLPCKDIGMYVCVISFIPWTQFIQNFSLRKVCMNSSYMFLH